jgi:hypothetical protein
VHARCVERRQGRLLRSCLSAPSEGDGLYVWETTRAMKQYSSMRSRRGLSVAVNHKAADCSKRSTAIHRRREGLVARRRGLLGKCANVLEHG